LPGEKGGGSGTQRRAAVEEIEREGEREKERESERGRERERGREGGRERRDLADLTVSAHQLSSCIGLPPPTHPSKQPMTRINAAARG
jgi:hypothetical protein